MVRVAGTDPGTSSLDVLVLDDGQVADQRRFSPAELQADPQQVVTWLQERGPLDLVAGPSGYGLPLIRAADSGERELALMTLNRPEERGQGQGVLGFSRLLRAFCDARLPVIFLPGVIHLSTVPAHRKFNRIDLGTADKLCVAALALALSGQALEQTNLCLVELGSAFTACLVLHQGRIVDGVGGSSGPVGWQAAGAWDGEVAYLLGPLSKGDLFVGGPAGLADREAGQIWFRESIIKAVAALQAVTPFEHIVLSGRLLEIEPELAALVEADLARLGKVVRLSALPGAWVKHAAQGAAVIADGLAGGRHRGLVEHLQLAQASGTALDWLVHPSAQRVKQPGDGGKAEAKPG